MYKLTKEKRQRLIDSGFTNKQVSELLKQANAVSSKTIKESSVKDKKTLGTLNNLAIDMAFILIGIKMRNIQTNGQLLKKLNIKKL